MKLLTKNFGEIEIEEKEIITFEEGIPGFLDNKKFIILSDGEDSPFRFLQSIDNRDLVFILIQPAYFYSDYLPDVPDDILKSLGEIKQGSLEVYSIVTLPEDITKMTANLKGPIIIHTENKKGMQAIVNNREYKVKHYVYEEIMKQKDSEKDGE